MRYAYVNGEKTLAARGLVGTCDICNSDMIPKCGNHVVAHWAHKSKQNCDLWYESETEWHIKWKDYFPKEWQEIVVKNEQREKHRADVRTERGLVVEVQHSSLNEQDIRVREKFYGSMIWIVDGSHLSFTKDSNRSDDPSTLIIRLLNRTVFLKRWADAKKPVFVDFGNDNFVLRYLKFGSKSVGLFGLVVVSDLIDEILRHELSSQSEDKLGWDYAEAPELSTKGNDDNQLDLLF